MIPTAKRGGRLRLLLAVVTASMLPLPATALTPADQRQIHDFTLTDTFLNQYIAITKQAQARGSEGTGEDAGDSTAALAELRQTFASLDAMMARIRAVPGAEAAITRHGLSLHDYVVGSMALLNTSMAVQMQPFEEKFKNDPRFAAAIKKAQDNRPSEANLRFFREHQAQIEQLNRMGEEDSGGQ